ncbi:hypothetical protein Tco_1018200 [Tanacetum coccineum]|uniref:Uncharacterized protein n=1 Tax=Tanacetum coccineum TaxID=301880 RepID=A0ABQ5FV24_9ASTR
MLRVLNPHYNKGVFPKRRINRLPLVITKYLVNISKRRAFWSLNKDILKITILTTNTLYPSRKIRRIRACTHQRPQRKQVQYAVSSEDQYAVLEIKALVERDNVGFDFTKSDLCPSFIEGYTAKGVDFHVADSQTGNHREDDFKPLETIRRFLGIIGSRSLSSSKGSPSGQRGGSGSGVPKAVTKPITHIEVPKNPSFTTAEGVPVLSLFWVTLIFFDNNVCFVHLVFAKMDFRSFMMDGVDGEFHFEHEGGVGDGEGSSPSIRSNIGDSNDTPSEKDVTSEARNQKLGKSSKATRKRKQIVKSSRKDTRQKAQKVPPQASKDSGDPSDPLDVDSDPDFHEFSYAKKLKDSIDCHWVVAHVTSPSWTQHLKKISLEKLCDIHDKAYMRQVVLDNMLNSRTRKDKNSLMLDIREDIKTMHGQVDRLHGEYSWLVLEENKWVNYEQTLAILHLKVKVAKVVPYVATKLARSDKMGLLVAHLAKEALSHGRCLTPEEVAHLKEPFELEKMSEVNIDPYAPLEVLLSKKPKSLRPKPAPSSSKPSSSQAPNPTS